MSQPGDKFNKETTAQEVVDAFADNIKGRYIIVTGTSSGGLGAETARAIATKAPKLLVIAGRDQKKLDETRDAILKETSSANIKTVIVDLNSLASVRKGAAEIASLGNPDVLINNAAIMMSPYAKTEDGIEQQFGVNYVGPWLLTNLLLPAMLKTKAPRIVFVSSIGHAYGNIRWDDIDFQDGKVYNKIEAYGQSKTAACLNALYLADRYGKDGLIAMSLHPGAIQTNLMRQLTEEDLAGLKFMFNKDGTPNLSLGIFKSIPAGASTQLVAAFDPRMEQHNGAYLANCQLTRDVTPDDDISVTHDIIRAYAKDKVAAQRLWDLTNKLTGEHF